MFREFHYQVRGRGHVLQGTRGQDRTAYLSRRGVQALCLSDGAGSAEQSEFGAQALVNAGCQMLVNHFNDFVSSSDATELKLGIGNHLLGRLTDVSVRMGVGINDLAATFMAVATYGDRFLVLHLGDGVVGYVKDGDARVVSAPDNSEFANQTTFLTSLSAVGRMKVLRGHLDGVSGFLLMSDGTASSLYNSRTKALAPACEKLVVRLATAPTRQVKNPEHKKQIKRLVDTKIRSATKDDCSLGILARSLA